MHRLRVGRILVAVFVGGLGATLLIASTREPVTLLALVSLVLLLLFASTALCGTLFLLLDLSASDLGRDFMRVTNHREWILGRALYEPYLRAPEDGHSSTEARD